MTERVIYAKASVERKPAFRQQTLILQRGEERLARKIPIGEEARAHVLAYPEQYRKLTEALKPGARIRLLPCEAKADGSVDFPYCAEETLRGRLRGMGPEAFLREVLAFREALTEAFGSATFSRTLAFDDLFGGVNLPGGLVSLSVTNADLNFDNVFCPAEGGWLLMDYEWVFDFPIPLDFVLYRALVLDPAFTGFSEGEQEQVLAGLGISRELEKRFHRMELGLLRYISPEEDKLDYFIRTPGARDSVIHELEGLLPLPAENSALNEARAYYESRGWFRLLRKLDRRVFRPAQEGIRRFARQDNAIGCACGSLVILCRQGPSAAFRKGIRPQIARGKVRKYLKQLSRSAAAVPPGARTEEGILISVCVPLYNTPEAFLREMIESVQAQTWGRWELCLADGSDDAHAGVGETCRELAAADPRIRYRKLQENRGISENTNAALEMATGDYIALLDHDDLLHPLALSENARAIQEQGADFLYSDELVFASPDRNQVLATHFKPDFAPENLLTNNYICHLSVFRRTLMEKVGRFRKAYDGSQDFDLILRLTDSAEKVVHLPKILYFWRSHPTSVAADVTTKPYAVEAGRRAVRDFLRTTRQTEAVVESTDAFPTLYHVHYPVPERAEVTLILDLAGRPTEEARQLLSPWEVWAAAESGQGRQVKPVVISESRIGRAAWFPATSESRARRLREAAAGTEGEYLLFLDPAMEMLTEDALDEMLMLAAQAPIGAVGGKIFFPDGTLRSTGLILGFGSRRLAGRSHYRFTPDSAGYFGALAVVQDVSAVPIDCMMVSRAKYEEVDGFPGEYQDTLFDVEFCLRLADRGYRNVETPFAAFRGGDPRHCSMNYGAEWKHYRADAAVFRKRRKGDLAKADPYYHPSLTTRYADFAPK